MTQIKPHFSKQNKIILNWLENGCCTYMSIRFWIMINKWAAYWMIWATVDISTVRTFTIRLLIQLKRSIWTNILDVLCVCVVKYANVIWSCFFSNYQKCILFDSYHFPLLYSSPNRLNCYFDCFGTAPHGIVDHDFVYFVNWSLTANRTSMTMWGDFDWSIYVDAWYKRWQ